MSLKVIREPSHSENWYIEGKKPSIYPAFPIQTIFQGNQIIGVSSSL